ncbi:serine/threonine-protein kinase [Psychrobacter urativorans]|uniref:Serine/threonine protein kinase n=1 Tax=Psychrobacter urativorans TaxID=45610 RepID=A0A0M4T8Z5_9GAMM|nr:serine/threonine-protein kinase [Psychrobacter urativorans]ALF60434.1 serine/threonine protein kinase [Psychrobacter urativorans]
MKNSNSNISAAEAKTQKLRNQAAQILPSLAVTLTQLGYDKVSHQRISQQFLNQQQDNKITVYQGLTRAEHSQFGCVMIKWALNADNDDDLSNVNSSFSNDLNHEITVLKTLSTSKHFQNNATSIAPALLSSYKSCLQVLDSVYRLTFMVMPYYKNGSLAHYLRQNKIMSNKQKYHLIVQSACLIARLHHHGWLHNDIKPSNILLEDFAPNDAENSKVTPRLLLTDFALAQRFNEIKCDKPAGTPAYLAPERWQGQGATMQSDIYAFGIMMVEIVTGNRPFKMDEQKSNEVLHDWAIAHCQKPISKLPEAYQPYQDIVNKALAKRVEKRYKSMEELLADLKQL